MKLTQFTKLNFQSDENVKEFRMIQIKFTRQIKLSFYWAITDSLENVVRIDIRKPNKLQIWPSFPSFPTLRPIVLSDFFIFSSASRTEERKKKRKTSRYKQYHFSPLNILK